MKKTLQVFLSVMMISMAAAQREENPAAALCLPGYDYLESAAWRGDIKSLEDFWSGNGPKLPYVQDKDPHRLLTVALRGDYAQKGDYLQQRDVTNTWNFVTADLSDPAINCIEEKTYAVMQFLLEKGAIPTIENFKSSFSYNALRSSFCHLIPNKSNIITLLEGTHLDADDRSALTFASGDAGFHSAFMNALTKNYGKTTAKLIDEKIPGCICFPQATPVSFFRFAFEKMAATARKREQWKLAAQEAEQLKLAAKEAQQCKRAAQAIEQRKLAEQQQEDPAAAPHHDYLESAAWRGDVNALDDFWHIMAPKLSDVPNTDPNHLLKIAIEGGNAKASDYLQQMPPPLPLSNSPDDQNKRDSLDTKINLAHLNTAMIAQLLLQKGAKPTAEHFKLASSTVVATLIDATHLDDADRSALTSAYKGDDAAFHSAFMNALTKNYDEKTAKLINRKLNYLPAGSIPLFRRACKHMGLIAPNPEPQQLSAREVEQRKLDEKKATDERHTIYKEAITLLCVIHSGLDCKDYRGALKHLNTLDALIKHMKSIKCPETPRGQRVDPYWNLDYLEEQAAPLRRSAQINAELDPHSRKMFSYNESQIAYKETLDKINKRLGLG